MMLLKYGEQRNCEFWIASEADTGRVLARIAADIPCGRAEESSIGFFDCHDTVEGRAAGRELIHTAMQWLADRGAQAAVAPMDFSSWFNYRFKVREQGESVSPDKSWEPSAPDFHLELFKDEGFQDFIAFSSLEYEIASPEHWKAYIALMQPDFQAAVAQGYTLSPFASGAAFQADLRDIFTLATIAFAENPMFEEIPFELFAALTTGLARKSNMDASLICRAADGSVAGFAFCFTEGNELIYKTVAVHPDHRSKGLANALTFEISSYCLKNNIRKTTGALIRSGNRSERIGHKHGQFAKPSSVYNYILLRKSLS
jgi:GNAT superfamily N-acetyltransferase